MPWYTITTAEITVGKPIDAELFKKMEVNVNQAISLLRLRESVPNPSFELSTGTVPLLWEISTEGGVSASLSTGCHGAKSLRFTKLTAGGGGGRAASDYFPLRPSVMNTLYMWAWASSTSIRPTVRLYQYDRDFRLISIATGWGDTEATLAATPSTFSAAMSAASNVSWGRMQLGMSTASGTGTLNFDELYYPWRRPMWYEISTAITAPKRDLSAKGLFRAIDNCIAYGKAMNSNYYVIPNGSFEWSTATATRPKLWTGTTNNSGAFTLTTGCHGRYSLYLRREATLAGDSVKVFSDDFIAHNPNHAPWIVFYAWKSTVAAEAGIKGGIWFQAYDSTYGYIGEYTNAFCNSSNWATTPTQYTYRASFVAASTETRWIKVGCKLDTASTVAGYLCFDNLKMIPY